MGGSEFAPNLPRTRQARIKNSPTREGTRILSRAINPNNLEIPPSQKQSKKTNEINKTNLNITLNQDKIIMYTTSKNTHQTNSLKRNVYKNNKLLPTPLLETNFKKNKSLLILKQN